LIEEDLKAVVQKGLAGVVLPKCESADDVAKVDKMIEQLEKERALARLSGFDLWFDFFHFVTSGYQRRRDAEWNEKGLW